MKVQMILYEYGYILVIVYRELSNQYVIKSRIFGKLVERQGRKAIGSSGESP